MEPFHFPQAILPGTFSDDYIGGLVIWPFSLASFLLLGLFPWILTAVLFGRGFCGWICWFGGLVEGMSIGHRQRWALSSLRETGPKLLTGLSLWTRSVKWILFALTFVLGLFFWVQPLNTIQWSGPIGWFANTINIIVVTLIFIIFFFILPFMTKKKWFCLLCPMGAGFNIFGRISPFRVKIDKSKCTQCNRCVPVCPTYSLDLKSVEKGEPDAHCDFCTDCMQECQEKSIDIMYRGSMTPARPWFIPTILTASILWYAWFIYTTIQLIPPLLSI
jgi:polyferredoxin